MPTPRRQPSRSSLSPERPEDIRLPTRSWDEVIHRVDKLWKPEYAPHHSIFGQNGAGKSYLIVNGLLPLCTRDNVCIFDSKGDDPVLKSSGARPVRQFPSKYRRMADNDKPKDGWLRLVIHDEVARAQDQVGRALEEIYKEGNWIVVLDETRAISDPRSPGLGLQPLLDRLWLRGRSRHISVIAATQAPRWVPTSFYDQCQFAWSSRIRDQRAHQRIMEIGSMTRAYIPHIARIRKRRWLYMDDEGDETWLAETGL
ncbi:MAG: hypothetical protein ACRD4I_15255 [Candidatus Angelobacter sp.]